mmetsp:Transcript_32037/g.46179  ORF Transcript_32037/g.46179 Transcript_32037/m.46179 type:complete len:238 (-) Transcript_32037:23-736(-)
MKISAIYENRLEALLGAHNVCNSHGIGHALEVKKHAFQAIQAEVESLSDENAEAVLLAALLHDADDKKFFPQNDNYQNLRTILSDRDECFVNLVIEMVELVSASKNGDSIPETIRNRMWMLIPRYSDRLEALGIIGIQRCYQYTVTTKAPFFTPETPRLKDVESILTEAQKRYPFYNGNSASMVDHFYDKLIGISVFPFKNSYFDVECEKRRQPLIDFLLYFAQYNDIDYSMVSAAN